MNIVKKRNGAAYTACICGLLYALPHFWWGVGISFGFPGDYAKAPDEVWSQIIGYWFMGIAAILAVLFSLSFVYKRGAMLPRMLKLVPAWVGCIGLSMWGFSFFVLKFQFAIGRVVSAPLLLNRMQVQWLHGVMYGMPFSSSGASRLALLHI